ncbi:TlpA family protein disulfide reductase [Cloacibacterium normanense]|uniref:Thioredoxin-like family protein n=2 Tax=Cloacibacterium TaxID=501783 RepID=A0A1E5UFH7_9FLAO|nr:TlpA disulfide reductase family protein [Cloacibacterium normanense]AZI68436.1 TlpA family protein disulfide reductase [Cloacibacterium normanense]OEL11578.1 thioredoxin-like family protein [Cloacibacterium normanense]SDO71598.1 Alkyl hydroperoxide reductase subunit AhpC (peroxiredoxin) [Cloacibacterium normanense]
MKRKLLQTTLLLLSYFASAQFTIKVESPKDFSFNEAYLYTVNGSKDILIDKAEKKNNTWLFQVKNSYLGLLKVYFPQANTSLNLVSENKNVDLKFSVKNNKVQQIDYYDEVNNIFYSIQDQQKKREQILPALYQIQNFYKENSDFGVALKNEVSNLSADIVFDSDKHPFLSYYFKTYQNFLQESVSKKNPTNDEIISFLNNTQNYLETSSLLKPILMVFLSNTSRSSLGDEVDKLLTAVNVETPRGQTILSELIEIFNVYSIKDLKEKYLTEAKNLKCTINDRLANTIKSNANTEIGKIIPNNTFLNPVNTKVKSLHDVKADKKIIILWSSTCSHCEKEIGEMVLQYNKLKEKNIEVVGLSLDSDAKSYSDKVKMLPWINDTELKGWYSSYVDTYNVHATPTFYIVDAKNKIIANPDNFSEILELLQLK